MNRSTGRHVASRKGGQQRYLNGNGRTYMSRKNEIGIIAIALLALVLFAACSDQSDDESSALATEAARRDEVIEAALENDGSWILHGRTYAEERFSPLGQINVDNVYKLELAWSFDFDTRRGQEATPVIVDGVMYTTSAWSKVQALNAATGELLWQFDPEVPGDWAVKGCCDVVNRGVAYWNGKVYVGAFDGRLIAIDTESGEKVWETDTITDRDKAYTITGAPRVVKGRVLIGNGGAEFGVRGYVSAYDAENGVLDWRFFTVPGDPSKPFEKAILEKAAETWTGEWWKVGGGGTVWDSMAYDPELDLVYIGVGNGSPWNPDFRSPEGGDNWFLSSIVALRPDTGEYVWHYQTTPGDQWDYTATQHMILADLQIDGVMREVLMQAPKNGFFYVLDRETGELISAEPFVPVNWADGVDPETGRPNIRPEAYYNRTEAGVFLGMPSFLGGHNWHPMSFSQETELVYIPAQIIASPYVSPGEAFRLEDEEGNPQLKSLAANLGTDMSKPTPPNDKDIKAEIRKLVSGHLLAWDPVAQEEVWRHEFDGAWNGGVLSTAGGLVFQGNYNGGFAAYDARNGEKLWERDAQTGVVAPPISYELNGEQYIAVVAGWGGVMPLLLGELTHTKDGPQVNRSRILVYKLGGDAPPLEKYDVMRARVAAPEKFGSIDDVQLGKMVYARYCAGCHGDGAVSGGVLPDLRWAFSLSDPDTWNLIVRDGALSAAGMVGFSAELSEAEIHAIRAYVVGQAHETGTVESSE